MLVTFFIGSVYNDNILEFKLGLIIIVIPAITITITITINRDSLVVNTNLLKVIVVVGIN